MKTETKNNNYLEKLIELKADLKAELKKTFSDKSEFEAFVSVTSKNPRFYANNILLIKKQFPQASLLYSASSWEDKEGDFRKVKEGEKGVFILAPYKNNPKEMGLKVLFDLSQTYHPNGYELGQHIQKNMERKETVETLNQVLKECYDLYAPEALEPLEQTKRLVKDLIEKVEDKDLTRLDSALLKAAVFHAILLRYAKKDSEKENLEQTFEVWKLKLSQIEQTEVEALKSFKAFADKINYEIRSVIYTLDKALNARYLQTQFKEDLRHDLMKSMEIEALEKELYELLPNDVTLENEGEL